MLSRSYAFERDMASPSMQERRADDRGAAVKVGIAASWRLRMRQRRGAPAATTATGAVACVGRGQLGLSAKISPPRVGTSPSCSKGHTCAGRTRCVSSDHSSAVAEAGDWLGLPHQPRWSGRQQGLQAARARCRAQRGSCALAVPALSDPRVWTWHRANWSPTLVGSSSLVIPGVRGAAAPIRKHRYAAAAAIRQRCGCPGRACSSCLQRLSLYCCQQSSLGLHPRAVHQVPIDQFHAADPPAGQERPWTTGVGR